MCGDGGVELELGLGAGARVGDKTFFGHSETRADLVDRLPIAYE